MLRPAFLAAVVVGKTSDGGYRAGWVAVTRLHGRKAIRRDLRRGGIRARSARPRGARQ